MKGKKRENVELLVKRKEELEKKIEEAKRDICLAPKGNLRITNCRGARQYYHVTEKGDTTGVYLSTKDMPLIYDLAQKAYAERFLKMAEKEVNAIDKFLASTCSERVFSTLSTDRKMLVNPYMIDDEEYVKRWMNVSFAKNTYKEEELTRATKRGDFVRSKSEAALADIYYELGIPYRYEAALVLRNGTIRYPDFTLLDVRNRREVYHEHFGLMDDSGYRRDCLQKLDDYRDSGIYMGRNFIMTYEGYGSRFDTNSIRKMIMDLFVH